MEARRRETGSENRGILDDFVHGDLFREVVVRYRLLRLSQTLRDRLYFEIRKIEYKRRTKMNRSYIFARIRSFCQNNEVL